MKIDKDNIVKKSNFPFLKKLESKMEEAKEENAKKSKFRRVYRKGASQIAKKMGEEVVEMVIASEQDNDENFLEESSDVFFYYLMSLHSRGYELKDVLRILKKRHGNLGNIKK